MFTWTKLKTDYIDLYQSHYDDKETPVSETMEAFDKLIKEGKVRYIGASNLSAARILESNDFAKENNLSPYVSIQPLYNLFDRYTFQKEYQQLVEKEGLAVMNYYALASGFLTGKYRSEDDLQKSQRGGGVKKYLNERGFRILKAMDKVAESHDVSLAQIALAWLLHKPFITTPIASATNEKQLKELVSAADLTLNAADMEILDKASAL